MELTIKSSQPEKATTQLLAIPVFESAPLSEQAQSLNEATGGLIEQTIKLGECKGKLNTSSLIAPITQIKAKRIMLFGLGKEPEIKASTFTAAMEKLIIAAKNLQVKDLTICLDDISVAGHDHHWQAEQLAIIAGNQCYAFNQFKHKDNQQSISLNKVSGLLSNKADLSAAKQGAKIGNAIAEGMDLTRTLGNLPGNVCNPNYLVKEAKKLAKQHSKLNLEVLDEKAMQKLGMEAFLAVSAGSHEPGKMIIMEYKGGKKNAKPQVLVGKGITFDSGGICIKPGPNMDQMKFDMCGAASVFGTLKAVLELELPINLVAVIAAAENMPSGTATRPGDIVKTLSGQTVEILNTDAEGRLVLCDALTYVERFKPAAVIDIATLTGAVIVALGHHGSAVMGNDDELIDAIKDAADVSGDKTWQLPMWDEHEKQLQSPYADIANISTSGPSAGSITAGCFLSKFTKAYPWAHLDIAGIAWYNGGALKGASGRPVPLLTQYLIQQSQA